jgi:hypothetical protein
LTLFSSTGSTSSKTAKEREEEGGGRGGGGGHKMKRDRIKKLPERCLLVFLLFVILNGFGEAAELVIRIPGDLSQQDGFYRLYYKPEVGSPQVSLHLVYIAR